MSTSPSTSPSSDRTCPQPALTLQLRSNPLYLSGVRELLAAVARRLGFPEEACSHIALAVDEALSNVISHGYSRDTCHLIWVKLFPQGTASDPADADWKTTSLKIVIEDEAPQVDPSCIKSRDLDQVRPGGLGVHIINTVMDHVDYQHRFPVGMQLTLIKNMPGPTETSSTPHNTKSSQHTTHT